jgi:ABC-type dipeptide/oligopeptide/nickel transport system permease subunit
VLLLLVMSMMLPDYSIIIVALVASLVLLPRAAAMIREAFISLQEQENWLQGLLWAVPVMLIFTVSGGILYTATVSYLGFGVPPPTPELGGMLSGTGRQYMLEALWMAYWPATCLALLPLTWVMAGEALLEKLGFRSKAVWAKAME